MSILPSILEYFIGMRKCQGHGGGYKFSKILSFIWKLEFYHWQPVLSVLSFEVTDFLPPQIWIVIVCLSFLKMVFHGKKQLVQFIIQSHKCSSVWQLYYLVCSRSDPNILPIFSQFFFFLAISNIAAMNIHIQISCICVRISVL